MLFFRNYLVGLWLLIIFSLYCWCVWLLIVIVRKLKWLVGCCVGYFIFGEKMVIYLIFILGIKYGYVFKNNSRYNNVVLKYFYMFIIL